MTAATLTDRVEGVTHEIAREVKMSLLRRIELMGLREGATDAIARDRR